jgi:hypothetical protein
MLISNRISFDMSEEDSKEVMAALQVLRDKLVPHLVDLGPEERRQLPKMGERTVTFVEKALDYARKHPELMPGFIDLTEWERDWAGVQRLLAVQRPLAPVLDMLDDSVLLCGSEAYLQALAHYQALKSAAKLNVPGAATMADDLALRFPGTTRGPRAGAAKPAAGAPKFDA